MIYKTILEKERSYSLTGSFCILFEKNNPEAFFLTDSSDLNNTFLDTLEVNELQAEPVTWSELTHAVSRLHKEPGFFGSELIYREVVDSR